MRLLLLALVLAATPYPLPAQPADNAAAQAQAKAAAYLELATNYNDAGEHERARALVQEAVAAAPDAAALRQAANALLRRILAAEKEKAAAATEVERRRRALLLEEAERLNAEGKFEEASKLIREHLDALPADRLDDAGRQMVAAHPGWWKAKWFELIRNGWVGDALLVIAALPLLWVLGRLLFQPLRRRFLRRFRRDRWRVKAIEDTSDLGAGELLLGSLLRWGEEGAPASSGLLSLQRLEVQSAPVFRSKPRLDLAAVLEPLPALGGVKPGVIAKAWESLRSWLLPGGAALTGTCSTVGDGVVIRLTARDPDGSLTTFGGVAEKTFESCVETALSVSFKMYYLIANRVTVTEAAAADRLRRGLQQLQLYATNGDAHALQLAEEDFSQVRRTHPTLEEAYLYEGVALDLLERHDEAERLFHHLAEQGERESLRPRARYNEAISKFRKYEPDELEHAIAILGELAGAAVVNRFEDEAETPPHRVDPFAALSLAARANGIAHKAIFWQTLALGVERTRDFEEIRRRKRLARETVEGWLATVQRAAHRLDALCAGIEPNSRRGWDEVSLRQLRWATANARGNAYLNCGFSYLKEPHLPGAGETELREAYFRKALAEFEQCEMLLSGVETLTNLATTHLNLDQLDKARHYARVAIQQNPGYAYAYYRLAQAWEREGEKEAADKKARKRARDKVIEVLKSLEKPTRISGFKRMFEEYGVEEPKAA